MKLRSLFARMVRPRYALGGLGALGTVLTVVALMAAAPASASFQGAIYTTEADCTTVNANIYDNKQDVYLNGGPQNQNSQGLPPNTTFYVKITDPSGATLLSKTDGTNTITSDDDGNLPCTQLWGLLHKQSDGSQGYDNTPNDGTEYKVWVSTEQDFPNDDAKTDNFKVAVEVPPAKPLSATKTATPSFDKTFHWDASKSVDKTRVEQIGGSATFNYTVTATVDNGTDGNWEVDGTVTVSNDNAGDVTGVDVSDSVDNGGTCTFTGDHTNQSIPAGGSSNFGYSCTYSSAPSPAGGKNTATVTWPQQTVASAPLAAGSTTAEKAFDFGSASPTLVDECATFSDTFDGTAGTLGQKCTTDTDLTFKYLRTVPVPPYGCHKYDNTADFATNDTGATDDTLSDNSQTVNACGPAQTGALTMGFWKGPNGNSLIQHYCAPAGKPSLATYLAALGAGDAGPFSDAAGKLCSGTTGLVNYVNGILNKASATDMNKMLKAQMLSTALDVYFSNSALGYSTTAIGSGKNQIKPPSNFLSLNGNAANLGGFNMDLTSVCPMVDNLNAGTATCKNLTPSTNAFGAGAVPWASQSVSGILTFAATADSGAPWDTGAFTNPSWYGTDRTKQEILKNVFDQINNQLAFSA